MRGNQWRDLRRASECSRKIKRERYLRSQGKMFKEEEVVQCVAGNKRNTDKALLNLATWRSWWRSPDKSSFIVEERRGLTEVVSRKHERKVQGEDETVGTEGSFQEDLL